MPGPGFSELEAAALRRFVEQYGAEFTSLAGQLAHARPVGRENTGSGFFTDIAVDRDAVSPLVTSLRAFDGPEVRVGTMTGALGLLLFVKDGFVNLLEGYSIIGEGTSSVDLVRDPFEFVADFPPSVKQ